MNDKDRSIKLGSGTLYIKNGEDWVPFGEVKEIEPIDLDDHADPSGPVIKNLDTVEIIGTIKKEVMP